MSVLQSGTGRQISYLKLFKSGTQDWREISVDKEALNVSKKTPAWDGYRKPNLNHGITIRN